MSINDQLASAVRNDAATSADPVVAAEQATLIDFTCFDLSSPSCPWNIFRPAETLAVHIWKINSEGVVPDLEAISNGTAAVLMVCILAFNLIARFVGKLLERRLTSE